MLSVISQNDCCSGQLQNTHLSTRDQLHSVAPYKSLEHPSVSPPPQLNLSFLPFSD